MRRRHARTEEEVHFTGSRQASVLVVRQAWNGGRYIGSWDVVTAHQTPTRQILLCVGVLRSSTQKAICTVCVQYQPSD